MQAERHTLLAGIYLLPHIDVEECGAAEIFSAFFRNDTLDLRR
jgi:hypothetical protein